MAPLLKFPARPYPKKAVVTGHLDGFAIRSRGVSLAVFTTADAAWQALKAGRQAQPETV